MALKKRIRAVLRRLRNRVVYAHDIKLDREYFTQLKDAYKGQRGFVIGNGPSLKIEDLEALKDEITVASNRIYLAFDQTEWRPSYYVNDSLLSSQKFGREIGENIERVHVDTLYRGYYKNCETRCWKRIGEAYVDWDFQSVPFSDDVRLGIYGGRTVTYASLQLAAHLGLDPIYLIGCDHNYKDQPSKPVGESEIKAESCQDHFHPAYRQKGEAINPAMIDSMTRVFMHARDWAVQNDRRIINATRGGFLEVFERADLDEVLKQTNP